MSSTISASSSSSIVVDATSGSITSRDQNLSIFEELVSKLFSCNIVLVMTDQARQYFKCCFGSSATAVTFANVLNQFALINNLHCSVFLFS